MESDSVLFLVRNGPLGRGLRVGPSKTTTTDLSFLITLEAGSNTVSESTGSNTNSVSFLVLTEFQERAQWVRLGLVPVCRCKVCHFSLFYNKNGKIEMSRIHDISTFSRSKKMTPKWPGIAVPSFLFLKKVIGIAVSGRFLGSCGF